MKNFISLVSIIYLLSSVAINAQQPLDSTAVLHAAAIADTGRMSPGYQDISRYQTPGMCLGAIKRVQHSVWRKRQRDTVYVGTYGDSIPTAAVEIGKRCALNLDLNSTPSHDIYDLIRLAALIRDETLAAAAVDRGLQLAANSERQGYLLVDAVEIFFHKSYPALTHLADSALNRYATLGQTAAAHGARAAYIESRFYELITFDTSRLKRSIERFAAMARGMSDDEVFRYQYVLSIPYYDSLIIAWSRRPDNLADSIRRYMLGAKNTIYNVTKDPAIENSTNAVIAILTEGAQNIGQVARKVDDGTFKFFPKTDTSVSIPEIGKVSLYIWGRRPSDGFLDFSTASYRRLLDKYSARGFEVIMVVPTLGYFAKSPPLSPEEEAKLYQWYYHDVAKLPVQLVVYETDVQTRADGQIIRSVEKYRSSDHLYNPTLIGKDGKVYARLVGLASESQMDAFIEKALSEL